MNGASPSQQRALHMPIETATASSSSSMMNAARVHQFGPPEAITIERVPLPTPGEGEVLVRVAAAGVGPWDAWIRAGKSVLPQPLPLTLGSDLSGTVAAVGPGVVGLRPRRGGLWRHEWPVHRRLRRLRACRGGAARAQARAPRPPSGRFRPGDRGDGLADAVRPRPPRRGPEGFDPRRRRQRRRLCGAVRPSGRRARDCDRLSRRSRPRPRPRSRGGDRLPRDALRGRRPGRWTPSSTSLAARPSSAPSRS